MTIVDTLLFGMVAGLVTLKVALLATAAILLVFVLMGRTRQHKVTHPTVRNRYPKADKHA